MSNSRFGFRTRTGLVSGIVEGIPAIKLLLDDFPNAAAAYSLRRLRGGYTGACIRVRRSNDNAEQDIGFNSNFDLDTTALLAFVGVNNGFVTTWYDQSTNNRNATQITGGNQPRIVNGGVIDTRSGKNSIVFNGTSHHLINSSTGFNINNTSMYAVSSRASTTNTNRSVFSTGTLAAATGFGILYSNSALIQDAIYMQSRYTTNPFTITGGGISSINQLNLLLGITTTSINIARFNGTQTTSGHLFSNNTSNQRLVIGGRDSSGTVGFFHDGSISEVVFWEGINQISGAPSIELNINTYYNIY